jgi:hypothetical protein
MARKHTTKAQDRAYLAQRFADAARSWKVGDACFTYDGSATTTIVAIDGDSVTLAAHGTRNDVRCFHISKLRSAK